MMNKVLGLLCKMFMQYNVMQNVFIVRPPSLPPAAGPLVACCSGSSTTSKYCTRRAVGSGMGCLRAAQHQPATPRSGHQQGWGKIYCMAIYFNNKIYTTVWPIYYGIYYGRSQHTVYYYIIRDVIAILWKYIP